MILSSFAEVVSIGAVLPFIGALSSPDEVVPTIVYAALDSISRNIRTEANYPPIDNRIYYSGTFGGHSPIDTVICNDSSSLCYRC